MTKKLDTNKNVYELCKEYPEIKDILVDLGLDAIKNPVMFNTVAKVMTIEKASKIKNIDMEKIDMEKGEYGDAMFNIRKARNIITELQSTLDFKYPVAKDFDIIYNYIFRLMVEANQKLVNIKILKENLVVSKKDLIAIKKILRIK